MAVFDTTQIEGFDGMTAEQKLEAVLKFDLPDAPDMSKFVSKETFDKKASEAANLSKQLRDKMTEDEQKKVDAPTAASPAENQANNIATLDKAA